MPRPTTPRPDNRSAPSLLESALVDLVAVLQVMTERQISIEKAVLLLAAGEQLPADFADQIRNTVRAAEFARELTLRGLAHTKPPAGSA